MEGLISIRSIKYKKDWNICLGFNEDHSSKDMRHLKSFNVGAGPRYNDWILNSIKLGSEITEIIISNDHWHRIKRTKSFINLLSLITLTIFEVKITATWRVLHQVNFHNGDRELQCDIEARWRHYHGDGKVNVVKTEKFRFSCTKQVRFSPNMQPTQTICAVDSPTLGLRVKLLLLLFLKRMRIIVTL